jgi:hypothetical protein
MSSVFGTHQDTDIEIIDILYMKLTRKGMVSFPSVSVI